MREAWNKLVETASNAGEFVESVTKNGISFLSSTLGRIPFVTSTTADDQDRTLEVDETHYFLVPYRAHECGYTLYSTRSLPPGVGPENSLPKARIFHLHDQSGVATLEALILKKKVTDTLGDNPSPSELADHLENLGETIDKESFKITSGLLIIGGAVAMANPVVGVGIAANALFPSLGAKASRLGLSLAGDKIRSFAKRKLQEKAEKEAKSEVKKLKPELYLNPLLKTLEQAVSTEDQSHDPLYANLDLVNEFPSPRFLRQSIKAILAVYQEPLEERDASVTEALNLHFNDLRWFDHLRELGESLQQPS